MTRRDPEIEELRETIGNSSRNSGSIATKDRVGEAFTRRMAPSVAAYGFLVSERRLIPQSTKPRLSRSLAYPRVIGHADPG
jgi:hypothetical protein